MKPFSAGQAERGKHGDAHPAAEQGSALHQAAEIVDPAEAAPLLEQSDEVEQRGRGDAVVEDLHEDAAQRRLHFGQRPRQPAPSRRRDRACNSRDG